MSDAPTVQHPSCNHAWSSDHWTDDEMKQKIYWKWKHCPHKTLDSKTTFAFSLFCFTKWYKICQQKWLLDTKFSTCKKTHSQRHIKSQFICQIRRFSPHHVFSIMYLPWLCICSIKAPKINLIIGAHAVRRVNAAMPVTSPGPLLRDSRVARLYILRP